MAIRQDGLHGLSSLCRFLYLLISPDLPLHHIYNGVRSDPLDGPDREGNEVATKWPQILRTKGVCPESFPMRHILPRGSVKQLSCSSPRELWNHFSTFSVLLCKVECKTVIKAVTKVKREGKLGWPVYRRMVSCRLGSQTPQSSSHTGRGVRFLHSPLEPEKSPFAKDHISFAVLLYQYLFLMRISTPIDHPESKITVKRWSCVHGCKITSEQSGFTRRMARLSLDTVIKPRLE